MLIRGVRPSAAFAAFLREVNLFEIRRGVNLDFDAKQRMIARADGFAIREAYLIPWWRLLLPRQGRAFFQGLKESEERLAAADAAVTSVAKIEGSDERHRSEICLNLHARTIQNLTLRRLYTFAAAASVAAVVLAAMSLAR